MSINSILEIVPFVSDIKHLNAVHIPKKKELKRIHYQLRSLKKNVRIREQAIQKMSLNSSFRLNSLRPLKKGAFKKLSNQSIGLKNNSRLRGQSIKKISSNHPLTPNRLKVIKKESQLLEMSREKIKVLSEQTKKNKETLFNGVIGFAANTTSYLAPLAGVVTPSIVVITAKTLANISNTVINGSDEGMTKRVRDLGLYGIFSAALAIGTQTETFNTGREAVLNYTLSALDYALNWISYDTH